MKYILLSFLVYLLYKSFFSKVSSVTGADRQKVEQNKKDDGDFIEYEEVE
jgi:hypothetical protein